jgi:lipopolysaccharide transport system ATP-binding protein
VAAHLDAEILLMDEVLAVGDAEFQKKALGKMGDVAKSGRTVLFVSHNMGAVKALCHRAIILERGSLKRVYEKINAAVADYLGNNNNSQTTWQNDGELSDVNFTPHRVYLVNKFYQPIEEINNAENVCLCLECDIKIIDHLLNVGISLSQLDGTVIFASWLKDIHTPELKTGKNVFYIELPTKNLNNGQYKITLSAGLHHVKYCINLGCEPSIDFTINNVLNTEFGDMERGGIYTPLIAWRTEL